MAKFKLTHANYYSKEANEHYWSASTVKEFLSCPARAMAELSGEYERPSSIALQIGSYVDAAFDGKKAFEEFVSKNTDIFKKNGELKSEFVRAQYMVDRAKEDPVFMEYMRGRKQTIKTGNIAGYPFRGKFDVYRKGERIVDLKTTKDFKPIYKAGQGRLSFADAWNWPLQMAIYQAIEGNNLPVYLACITKEEVPDIEVIQIPQEKLDAEMDFLKEKMPYFDAIRQGIIEPERCEECAYCRATKKLKGPRLLDEFNEFMGVNE